MVVVDWLLGSSRNIKSLSYLSPLHKVLINITFARADAFRTCTDDTLKSGSLITQMNEYYTTSLYYSDSH